LNRLHIVTIATIELEIGPEDADADEGSWTLLSGDMFMRCYRQSKNAKL
jgi:hypothetical protein